ncbi:IS630 family transposase [Arthrobacter sp. SDTb3-6]|nr:IS630 family transposase [Arthrobacter sp. SDTb3-6]
MNPGTVRVWRNRFASYRLKKLGAVAAGRGRKPVISELKINGTVELTRFSKPEGATQWSVGSRAARSGVSPAQVQRIWAARGLKPHLVETFKLSEDPHFDEKLINVCGLYLDPPENAIVLCLEGNTSIQAMDHNQPSLLMQKGRGETMTHDYKRNGTTTLFAALEVATGKVIGSCIAKHRHEEFPGFLKTIEKEVPNRLEIHLILDNYATHKHPEVKPWLDKHPRFHLHFTPTSSSWLNLVERTFRDLTDWPLRRAFSTQSRTLSRQSRTTSGPTTNTPSVSGHENVPIDGQQEDHYSVAASGHGSRRSGAKSFSFHCPRGSTKDHLPHAAAASPRNSVQIPAGSLPFPAFPRQ